MIEVLEFIFGNFWHYIGTVVLLWLIFPWTKIKIVNLNKRDDGR